MKSQNPQNMIQNLIKSNPQYAQAWEITQQIMSKGGSKQDMINNACKQSGINPQQVEQQLNQFGIKF